jgi:S-formylglutathione hydrolase FrmB
VQGLGFRTTVRSITWMSPRSEGSQTWLDNLGDWAWPGLGSNAAAAEALPPSWVPARPPALTAAHAEPAVLPTPWLRARRLLIAALLIALAGVSLALALEGRLGFGGHDSIAAVRVADTGPPSLLPSPALRPISVDSAGSEIAHVLYPSASLRRQGSFYVYEPPALRTAAAGSPARYPVLYLLHGNSQHATAFLEAGLQEQLDALIRTHAIPPMIAVMVQGGGGANNWRNLNGQYYESYVLEVQEIVDRILPTIADRSGRAIAGVSMGGYGAMELALDNPGRFGVVESWLGFFNGLEDQLAIDKPAIRALGLSAFVYGGEQDKIANPSEDAPFAAAMRAAGADAHSALYPGEHNMETVQEHMPAMLTFAGRALAKSEWSAAAAHGTN